jgi:AcrR family transcriptional regulator
MTTQVGQRGRSRGGKGSAEVPPGGGRGTEGAAPRGRPRSEKARKAILGAAAELLLARGLSAVSMDAVAERAGVSKATIYRWWPTKETLALDALYTEWATVGPSPRDTGSLRGDLLALLRPWARLTSSRSYGRVIAALITEAQTDPVFAAEYRQRVVEPRRDQARAVFRRAIERGQIPPRHQHRSSARPALRPALSPAAARPRATERPVHPRRHRHGAERHPAGPAPGRNPGPAWAGSERPLKQAGTTHRNTARPHPASVWAREGLAQGSVVRPGVAWPRANETVPARVPGPLRHRPAASRAACRVLVWEALQLGCGAAA